MVKFIEKNAFDSIFYVFNDLDEKATLYLNCIYISKNKDSREIIAHAKNEQM